MDTISMGWLLMVGFGLGLKHAIEPDHLAAVSTMVGDRKSIWSASLIGGLWGIGHTTALLIAGVLVMTFHLEIAERTGQFLELGVAVMLIILGIDALRKVVRGGQVHWHTHRHGGIAHAHPHIHDKARAHGQIKRASENTHHGLKMGRRPLIIGLIHGLAGSGALMLLVLSTISSPVVGTLYILVFGAGSIGGMMLMSTLIGLPFRLTANRFARAELLLRGSAALFSLSFGLFLFYRIGFTEGLLAVLVFLM
jgi:ABC-type nickel/cobalt efflux system permease component RcnA